MITNLQIGYNGRLGNQMFQFAMLLGVADKNILSISIPKVNTTLNENKHWFQLPDCFDKIKHFLFDDVNPIRIYIERQFEFNRDVFDYSDGTNFTGYFQTEKYFEHCKNQIRQLFTFNDSIKQEAADFLKQFTKETVVLNIRRGDYVKYPQHHPILPKDYYTNTISEHFTDKHYDFICVSDDIPWCKNEFPALKFVEGKSIYVQLCILTMVDNVIMANSSFSWWGAWLNQKVKKVIAPNLWFGEALKQHDLKDLYCKEWIRM